MKIEVGNSQSILLEVMSYSTLVVCSVFGVSYLLGVRNEELKVFVGGKSDCCGSSSTDFKRVQCGGNHAALEHLTKVVLVRLKQTNK
jgi:hypothetical protein